MANKIAKCPRMTPCLVGRLQESIMLRNYIHCLSDELLMEILRRLPNSKSVMQCKFVCKRWAALTSHSWFISQFIDLKFGDGVSGTGNDGIYLKDRHQTYAIIMWYKPDRFPKLWQGSEIFFRPSIFNSQDSSFFPFTHCLTDDIPSVTLVATFSDLLLYCRHEKDKKYTYYISNVQTRLWIELPTPPYYYGRLVNVGLICDPFYSNDRKIVVNAVYRYSIVVIPCTAKPSSKFIAHVLSSANHGDNHWCNRVLSLPKTCTLTPTYSAFCFDGKLYFTCREGLFGFNQNSIEFDDEIQCDLVKWPAGMSLFLHRVGVSQENLKVSCLKPGAALYVWVLEDYNTSHWMLQHKFETWDCLSPGSWMAKKLERFSLGRSIIDVLGFHPSRCDVIYLLTPGYIFLCNLSTRTLRLACRIPVAVAERCKRYLKTPYDYPVMLRCWPTPLTPFSRP